MVDASLMPEAKYFGDSLSRMWKDLIGSFGDYSEIFERNLAGLMEGKGRNNLNKMIGLRLYTNPGV